MVGNTTFIKQRSENMDYITVTKKVREIVFKKERTDKRLTHTELEIYKRYLEIKELLKNDQ